MVYRKIIQLSPTTKVISLPSDWLKKNSIKKGDSVSVKEEDNKIIIESESSEDKFCSIDARKLDEDLLWMVVDTVYMLGYSHVKLKLTLEQMNVMITLVKFFPVFVISSESKDGVELKALSKSLDMDIDKTLQRIRQLTNFLIDDGLKGASAKSLKKIDYTINTYVSMSFRFLSTSSMGAGEVVVWSQFVKILEIIADRICIMFNDVEKSAEKTKISSKDKKKILKIRELYNMSFSLLHKFSDETANSYDMMRRNLELEETSSILAMNTRELAQSLRDLEEIIFQICVLGKQANIK